MVDTSAQAAAATHSGRIKYADPKALPSFPSPGLRPDGAAAGAAATLGWHNQKPVELWRPDKTSSASAAAVLAKDYKMSAQWEPSTTSAGHKAAMLAVGSAGVALKQHSPASKPHDGWDNSAATQAFHAAKPTARVEHNLTGGNQAATQAFRTSQTHAHRHSDIIPDHAAAQASRTSHSQAHQLSDASPEDSSRSLAAAKGAMSQSRRPRSTSFPATPSSRVDTSSPSAAGHAMSGATLAHRASVQAKPRSNAGAVPTTTMTRNMFTSHPALKMETDETDQNEKLHQTAVAMARRMYNQQQKMLDQAKKAQEEGSEAPSGPTYLNLQDAAYKQAQDRLAKLHDEHQQNREFQAYYGHTTSPSKKRFSMTNKLHRRASSDGLMEDHQQSEKIRKEMSIFSSKLSQVDQSKQTQDREALLAAAQRNVKAQLKGMDEKVYNETGKMNPSLVDNWELKARETAEARSAKRDEHKGMVDIGGGKFMDPEEVNAIAAKSLQPWLDDINEKAEIEQARQAELRLEEERRKDELAREKAREKEWKDLDKQQKEQEKQDAKAKKAQEKEGERARKAEEKAAKAEQKRLAKGEKRKSKQEPEEEKAKRVSQQEPVTLSNEHEESPSHVLPTAGVTMGEEEPVREEDTRHDSQPPLAVDTAANGAADADQAPVSGEGSSTSPTSKVRGWIRNRFSRGKSAGEGDRKRGSFMGGASLKSGANDSNVSLGKRQSETRNSETLERRSRRDSREAGSGASNDDFQDAADLYSRDDEEEKDVVEPPRPIKDPSTRTSSSPTRDSRFREEIS